MSDDFVRLNEEWNRAWLRKDLGAVEHLMAREYVYVAPNGRVLDRQTILSILGSPSYRLHAGSRSELTVRVLASGVALLTDRWQGEGTYEGRTFRDDHRCTSVLVRNDGRWQIVFEQCSPITGAAPSAG